MHIRVVRENQKGKVKTLPMFSTAYILQAMQTTDMHTNPNTSSALWRLHLICCDLTLLFPPDAARWASVHMGADIFFYDDRSKWNQSNKLLFTVNVRKVSLPSMQFITHQQKPTESTEDTHCMFSLNV